MEVRPGPTIDPMPSAMSTRLLGTRVTRVVPTKLVAVAQHGARMAGRPGSVLIRDVTAITHGAWRLIPTTPIAGLSRPAQDRGRRITREAMRKPTSIAGAVTAPGKPSTAAYLSHSGPFYMLW